MDTFSPCPNCGGGNQYLSLKEVSAGGGHAPNFLPDLGTIFSAEKFRIVVCSDCGLTRFFARRSAREKLRESEKWKRM